MKELINSQTINDLKKSRRNIILCIIISLALAIAIIVPLFFLATRELKYLFVVILTIVSTLEASFVLYVTVVYLVPLNNYIKQCELSLVGSKFMTKGKVVEIAEKITHFKGIAVREIKVMDLEEENKEYKFYVEQTSYDSFIKDKTYSFVAYQSLITSYEEHL